MSSYGSAPARSAPTTVVSGCSSGIASGCSPHAPRSKVHPTAISTTRSAIACCAPARASGPISSPRPAPPTTAVVLSALWDLVWAGEVTNDTFGPLRVPRRAARRSSSRARPHPGRLSRLGPPAGAGRWSLVVPSLEPEPTPTERAHSAALQLLERQGVVTREAVRAEGSAGGFAGVYPVLRVLEESGRARRGWFVAGLGAAQFALPGAVDRLRARTHDRRREPRARPRARRHRPGPALRSGAVVARAAGRVGARFPIGGCVRGPRRR